VPALAVAALSWFPAEYARAVAATAAATAVAWLMFPLVEAPTLILPYLVGTVAVATRAGRGASVFASLLSVAAFDFFFVPPYFTFGVAEIHHVLTFAVMLGVALVISGLTVRTRRQAQAAEDRERQTVALYAMSRELAQATGAAELSAVASRHIGEGFDVEVELLPSDRTDPDRSSVVLPLLGHKGPMGSVRVRPRRRAALASPERRRQLEMFVNQAALALERARLAAEAEDARIRAETERLRNALLTSVSHDLRTPLAAITGAATTMLDAGARLEASVRRELLESIRDEADRLNRLVQNLLEMTRLESGALQLRRDWHPLEEVVGAALGRLAARIGRRQVVVTIPPELPLVPIDDVLIEQVLLNLVENALKYSADGRPIRILATATDAQVTVEVADAGTGLPQGQEELVFEKFTRAAADGPGAGLGLAICRGIVDAHGGHIWAQNLPEGGAAFLFTLPLAGRAPASVPADA
jgi:two-component system sensor histidine kinase KdpD